MQINKPLYIEAYKIMAAITEVITTRNSQSPDYSAVSYYVCLTEMIMSNNDLNIEATMYAYSAIVLTLDLGVITN